MNELHLEIKNMIIEALDLEDLGVEDIDSNAPLFGDSGGGLGLDSIDALELGVALRKRYHITLNADDPNVRKYFHSVATLADLISTQRGETPAE